MTQQNQLTNKLSTEDIDNLIKNPLPPPIQFMDKQLPQITDEDIKNLPHPPKELLEGLNYPEDFIKEAEDKIINCYCSWREQDLDEDEEENKYCYDNFDIYCNQIELDDEEYDDFIIENARESASFYFQGLYNESIAEINCIKKEMNINKRFSKQNAKMKRIIRKYLLKNKTSKNFGGREGADWDDWATGFKTKKDYRIFIKDDIIKRIEI